VQGKEEQVGFYFDAGLIDDEDCDWDIGQKITIYYEPYGFNDHKALKVNCRD